MQHFDLLFGKNLGQIVILHRKLAAALHIAQVNAQLLRLKTAVIPPSGKSGGLASLGKNPAVLIGQGNLEQAPFAHFLPARQPLNAPKRKALVPQQLIPMLRKHLAELGKSLCLIHRAPKGKGADKHAGCLFGCKIGAVKHRNANHGIFQAGRFFQIDGQGHVKHSKRRHPPLLAKTHHRIADTFGQQIAFALSHRADRRAVNLLERGRLAALLEERCPVSLIFSAGGALQILLLLADMQPVFRRRRQLHRAPFQQIQIDFLQFVAQKHLRPAVGNQVMQFHQDPAVVLTGFKQPKTAQSAAQNRHRFSGQRLRPVFYAVLPRQRKIEHWDRLFLHRHNILNQFSFPHFDTGAQRRIGLQEQADALLQKIQPELSLNPYRGCNVID